MRFPARKIKVTKLNAAQRQFQTSIHLWFTGGDPVAIHTLASASHEIIHTLFKRAGLHGLLFDTDYIKDEFRRDWAQLLKRSSWFFKHAREDPDGEIEFDPNTNEGILVACLSGLQRLGASFGMEERCLLLWLKIHHPTWFPQHVTKDGIPINLFQRFGHIDRYDFLEDFEILWREGKAPGQPNTGSSPAHA